MKTDSFKIGSYQYTVAYQPELAFYYSQYPVRIYRASGVSSLCVRVTNTGTGQYHRESRYFYGNEILMDLSNIMRNLAPDTSEMIGASRSLPTFRITIENEGGTVYHTINVFGIPGALNANETYREPYGTPEKRRLWINYPQTFELHTEREREKFFDIGANRVPYLDGDEAELSEEASLVDTVEEQGGASALATLDLLRAGQPQTVYLSNYYSVDKFGDRYQRASTYPLLLIPDNTPRDAAGRVFLRWLQRDGSVGYWLFYSGEEQSAFAESNSFERYTFNPNEPSYVAQDSAEFSGNPRQGDFKESRTLRLGAVINNADEYDYLLGLMSSPVVDRLLPGDRDIWERVNILPSTMARSRKFDTPTSRQIEITIQLPDRDTIKL